MHMHLSSSLQCATSLFVAVVNTVPVTCTDLRSSREMTDEEREREIQGNIHSLSRAA